MRGVALAGMTVALLAATAAAAGPGHRGEPTSIAFWNLRYGVAAVNDWATCGQRNRCRGEIAVTGDGGRTWKTRWRGTAVRSVVVVHGSREAWAAVEPRVSCETQLPSPCPTRLLHSTDGGDTWQAAARGLLGPSFPSPRVGYAFRPPRGRYAYAIGPLVRTTDGGRTWKHVGGPCRRGKGAAVSFVSPERGWLLCTSQPGVGMQPKAVYETRDGGRRWRLAADAFFTRIGRSRGGLCTCGYPGGIAFARNGHGLLWQSRGHSYSTSDAGLHWHRIALTDPEIVEAKAAWIVSGRLAYLVLWKGDTGEFQLVRSRDRGRTWRVLHRWP